MQALYDAADDDSATGGPDLTRRIYPVVAMVTADGFRRLTDEEAGRYAEAVVGERMQSPGRPAAPLHRQQRIAGRAATAIARRQAHPPADTSRPHE